METQEDITISFFRLDFSNLTFSSSGYIFKFRHQIYENTISVSESTFTDIEGGHIFIEAANKNNLASTTKVSFSSCQFLQINAVYDSFMHILEGAEVQIADSSFSNIFTFEEGAVIFAGNQKAVVIITNSTFTNNYAVTGGVFYIERESVIKLYN